MLRFATLLRDLTCSLLFVLSVPTLQSTAAGSPAVRRPAAPVAMAPLFFDSGVVVSVAPPAVTLAPSEAQQFTATVTGTTNTAVTWSITPADAGTISTVGLYLPPGTVTTQRLVTVTAVSQADPTKSGAAAVTLVPSISVSITPANVGLAAAQSKQFAASIIGSANTAVTWSVSPADAGSIGSDGVYQAPGSVSTQRLVTITATSQADPTRFGTANVTLYPAAVFIDPPTANLYGGQTQQFSATVINIGNTAVSWSISPTNGAPSAAPACTHLRPSSVRRGW